MVKAYVIEYGNERIHIDLVRSSRKTMALQVKEGGKVVARVPYQVSDKEIEDFIVQHKDWVVRKCKEQSERSSERPGHGAPAWDQLTSSQRSLIRRKFEEKVSFYAAIMGVTFGKISIRNQKTRWGSCSSKGNLNFNYRLYYMPESIMDYVVIHELAHRRHMNHSPEFWNEVGRYCPNYKECRKYLRS